MCRKINSTGPCLTNSNAPSLTFFSYFLQVIQGKQGIEFPIIIFFKISLFFKFSNLMIYLQHRKESAKTLRKNSLNLKHDSEVRDCKKKKIWRFPLSTIVLYLDRTLQGFCKRKMSFKYFIIFDIFLSTIWIFYR